MWIYKITNNLNGKSYIGQTKRPVTDRWKRHLNDAIKNKLDTHFARAIRKYGEKNFSISIIAESNDQDELNKLEHKFINEFDCLNNGYNETDSITRSGGNTYASKTKEELELIRDKIRKTKLGGLNPMSKSVKMIDTFTGKVTIFSSAKECSEFLKLPTHHPVARRASGKITKLLSDRFKFEYL